MDLAASLREHVRAAVAVVKTALVSGSAGFVGRHMGPALEARGYQVRRIDLKDPVLPVDALRYYQQAHKRYDLIVHLAANVGGRASIDGSPLHVATNLALDSLMFDYARRTRPGRVLYFSSSAAYPKEWQGRGCRYLLRESRIDLDRPGLPDATYGWAKLTGELLATYAREAGVPVTVVRPFSGYGDDQPLDYPFPSFIHRAATRQDPFDVWGDGTAARDWIHIDDVIEASLRLVEAGVDEPVNLCTGRAVTFAHLARMVCDAAGYTPELNLIETAPQGVHWRVGDPTVLHRYYIPTVTLEQGIERALQASRPTGVPA